MRRKFLVVWRYLKARRDVSCLRAAAKGEERRWIAALEAGLRLGLSTEERAWVGRIEALRRELNASTEPIERFLYGLRPETPHPPGRQLENGRVVTETVGVGCRRASRQKLWCLLLFRLVRALQPVHCLELGTAYGVSAAYQGAALELNGMGQMMTLEGDENVASIARRSLASLGISNVRVVTGRFEDTLASALREMGQVDYVFLDGGKYEDVLWRQFEEIVPFASAGAVLVFDDIRWSPDMERAWNRISRDERVRVSLDLEAVGVLVL